jgi:hypothetical protein
LGRTFCRCHRSSSRLADSRFSVVAPVVLPVPGFSLPVLPKITRRDFDRLCIYVDTAQDFTISAKNLVFRLNVDVTSKRCHPSRRLTGPKARVRGVNSNSRRSPVDSSCRFRGPPLHWRCGHRNTMKPLFSLPPFSRDVRAISEGLILFARGAVPQSYSQGRCLVRMGRPELRWSWRRLGWPGQSTAWLKARLSVLLPRPG